MNDMEKKKYIKVRSTICLLITSMIWGAAFVAQSVSMDYIGPMTFICLRSLIGTMVLFPVITAFDSLQGRTGTKDSDDQMRDVSARMESRRRGLTGLAESWRGCLRDFFIPCQLCPTDRHPVYNSRKSRLYHSVLHYSGTCCRTLFSQEM